MKRLVSATLVLLALAAAAFFFVKLRPFLPERSRAAELAPANPIFFAHFPNLRQTALRFPQTDLYQIWREGDVQTFLEKPRAKAPWMREWEVRFEAAVHAAPGEAFVAVTATDGPQFVAGFSFAGGRHAAEALAADLRAKFAPQAILTFRSNWVLAASNAMLLQELIARFEAKESASLANDKQFQKATADLGVERDFVAFGRADVFDQFLPVHAASVKPKDGEVIAMATRLDGGRLRDTISLPAENDDGGTLSLKTLELAPVRPMFVYVGELGFLPPGMESVRSLVPRLPAIEKLLAAKGLAWDELPLAIGPEVMTVADWAEDATLPTLLIGAEIRDADKARAFLDVLTDRAAFEAPWETEDHDGVKVSIAPSQAIAIVRPSLALTDRFALLGLSPETVAAALAPAKPAPSSPAQHSPFQTATQAMPAQSVAFAFLDFPRFFDRTYRLARPFITLSFAFSPEAGVQFDAGKLPPVESFTRHLNPTVLSVTRTKDRTVVCSAGTLTLPELLLTMSAANSQMRLPELSGILPGSAKLPPPPKRAPTVPSAQTP